MIASEKGHLDVVKTLIEAGANVNHTNKVGLHTQFCCTDIMHIHTSCIYMYNIAYIYCDVCMYP